MKVYRIDSSRVWVNAVLGNLLLVGVLAWAIYERVQGATDPLNMLLLIALPPILISAFAGNHQPTEVVLGDDAISFTGIGPRYTYEWKQLKYLHVKRFFLGDRYLVQIGEFRAFSGRYWIPYHMPGAKELEQFLKTKADQIRNR